MVLKVEENKMQLLPPMYAYGFKAIEKDSIIKSYKLPGIEEETKLSWPSENWLD